MRRTASLMIAMYVCAGIAAPPARQRPRLPMHAKLYLAVQCSLYRRGLCRAATPLLPSVPLAVAGAERDANHVPRPRPGALRGAGVDAQGQGRQGDAGF